MPKLNRNIKRISKEKKITPRELFEENVEKRTIENNLISTILKNDRFIR